jgi:hypothetical protein
MQSIWSESWKSSEFITTKIAFTSRSVAALQENDLANRYPPMPSLTTTLGGTTAAVCFRCQSQRNYEFAMDRFQQEKGIAVDGIVVKVRWDQH